MVSWGIIAQHISTTTGVSFIPRSTQSVAGGSINSAYRLADGRRVYFIKCNSSNKLVMFEAEAEGLLEIARANVINVPEPVCTGVAGQSSYIVLQNIEIDSAATENIASFGQQLAAMHRITNDQFGWHRDNTIGSTTQFNTFSSDWPAFWRDQRLGYQLELAAENGFGGKLIERGELLKARIHCLFDNVQTTPSLLHGDLWSGNYAFDGQGRPVIFDPAVYYGDREADLAMTELFGGFSPEFYRAYEDVWPLDGGYKTRKILYNLYHILNHLNLFGGGYLSQSESMIERLLNEC